MLFEPFNWLIGTCEYYVDYEKVVKDEILKHIKNLSSSNNNYYVIKEFILFLLDS